MLSSRRSRVVVFGLWSAFFGTALVCDWLFSRYTEVQHNANLFVFWPVDGSTSCAGKSEARMMPLPGARVA